MSVTFFLDRNLGGKIFPGILREAGVTVVLLEDHFKPEAPDEEWITWVAKKKYFAVGNDYRILRNVVQREVVLKAGLGYFVIRDAQCTARVSAENFLITLPKVEQFIVDNSRPFIASILKPSKSNKYGAVQKRYPRD